MDQTLKIQAIKKIRERLRRAGLVKLMAAAIRDHPELAADVAAEHGATETGKRRALYMSYPIETRQALVSRAIRESKR